MTFSLIYNVSFAVLTVLAFVLSIISLLAYNRVKNKKLLLVSFAFIFFFLKGLWLSYSLFVYPEGEWHFYLAPVAVFDSLILIMLYLAVVKG